ncbi:hypothetical protein JOD63_000690 [Microbacterium terrae]|nr:hypothetical protein [Microbacterium terrae]
MPGARPDRPGLKAILEYAREGDVITVVALDHLGRSMTHVILIIEELQQRGVLLRSLREGVDFSQPLGKMLAGIFASLAEYERAQIRERADAAREAARARGKQTGRPRVLDDSRSGASASPGSPPPTSQPPSRSAAQPSTVRSRPLNSSPTDPSAQAWKRSDHKVAPTPRPAASTRAPLRRRQLRTPLALLMGGGGGIRRAELASPRASQRSACRSRVRPSPIDTESSLRTQLPLRPGRRTFTCCLIRCGPGSREALGRGSPQQLHGSTRPIRLRQGGREPWVRSTRRR